MSKVKKKSKEVKKNPPHRFQTGNPGRPQGDISGGFGWIRVIDYLQ